MSREQSEPGKARELVSEVDQEKETVANTISDDTGSFDPRFALWRSFCTEFGVPVETLPGDLAEPLKGQWEKLKDVEIHRPEEGRT